MADILQSSDLYLSARDLEPGGSEALSPLPAQNSWERECTCPDFCERDHQLD